MAVSDPGTILTTLATTLAGIDATGSYTYDLSDSDDRIQWGALVAPPLVPCVTLMDYREPVQHGPPLGAYERKGQVSVIGYVAGTEDTPKQRLLAACDLLRDIRLALEGDRGLGGVIRDLVVEGEAFDGLEWGLSQLGVVVVQVGITYVDLPG